MLLYLEYLFVFVVGACVGSFLNVCVARIPWEKSLWWPGSRCGRCFQPVRWYDNVPLFSYWALRGRCRSCGEAFSVRYFLIELLTGLGFLGLFHLEVVANIHEWDLLKNRAFAVEVGAIPGEALVLFAFHATLFSFLLTVAVCDLDRREIPLPVTLTGTAVGLLGAVLFPWPWPYLPEQATRDIPSGAPWWLLEPGTGPKLGLYPWPVWGPLPDWLAPGGNWQTGLATGLAGMLAGTLLLRAVRFLFSTGLQVEALGLGDADLMMMAGAFLGWQPVVVAFFVSVFPALVFGIIQMMVWKDNALPFGPSLAAGVVLTFLGWRWIGPHFQAIFFWREALLVLGGIGAVLMFGSGYLLRFLRGGAEAG